MTDFAGTKGILPPGRVEAIVVGGGHAGIEAAWALARLGHGVAMVTFDARGLARMSCNPSIGGLAKGQLAREIDALGGLMGRLIDQTGIHFRMLNRSKGPAVHAPRAQADRDAYSREALRKLTALDHLLIVEAEVTDFQCENGRVTGVALRPPDWSRVQTGGAHSDSGSLGGRSEPPPGEPRPEGPFEGLPPVIRLRSPHNIEAAATILTVGTFLRGKLHTGDQTREGGRRGEPAASSLSAALRSLGLELGRLKTGTPPRLARETIDFSRLKEQPGDEPPPRFSYFENADVANHVLCHLTRTSEKTHAILTAALDRSPMFSGKIEGAGPRYCPSIEDKVVRFPDRRSHQVFLEPEGLNSDLVYPNGVSTSMPIDVQEAYIRTIDGLEEAVIVHPGYAVEYDFLLTSQIDAALGVRGVGGLFAAGQINGTSGYEEAAAQGIMAGLNAHAEITGRPAVTLGRSQAYIGVLIDDLVTKIPTEPYRMFTSQSEYRLRLRQDNADRRLSAMGHELGLLDDDDWRRATERWAKVDAQHAILRRTRLSGRMMRDLAPRSGPLSEADAGRTYEELLKRPEVDFDVLRAIGHEVGIDRADETTLLAEIKYAGYIEKQSREIERTAALEKQSLPEWLLSDPPVALSGEARERLMEYRPQTMGHAMRIPGITPSDLFILAIHLRGGRGRDSRKGTTGSVTAGE